jgi:hypothetical protein
VTEPVETHVRSIRPEADADLVATLRKWLEDAERGEIIGAVLLANGRGNTVMHGWAGRVPLDRALYAFEKFKQEHLLSEK